jgi:hypothetical protein
MKAPACDMGRSTWMGFEKFVGSLPVKSKPANALNKVASYLLSANLSREKAPPSRGKLVLKMPFFEAGVPASSETRNTKGVYAGGRRIYYIERDF